MAPQGEGGKNWEHEQGEQRSCRHVWDFVGEIPENLSWGGVGYIQHWECKRCGIEEIWTTEYSFYDPR